MQKRKIDLRQLGATQLARWPQRRARLAEIRQLGAGALLARSARLRAEHFMVALAVVMLFLAIILSSVLAPSAPKGTGSPVVAINPTGSRTQGTSATPVGALNPTIVVAATPSPVAAVVSGTAGTSEAIAPYPGASTGPLGIGTPPPNFFGPTPAGGTPPSLPTFQPIPGGAPNGTPGANGGYPGPGSVQVPTAQPAGAGPGIGQPYPGVNAPPPNVQQPTSQPRPNPGGSGGGPLQGFTPIPTFPRPPVPSPVPMIPTSAGNGNTGSGGNGSSGNNGYPGPGTGGQPSNPTPVPPVPTRAGQGGGPSAPTPTAVPVEPTAAPTEGPPPTATPIPPTPTATAVPFTVLSGDVHWTAANSPIRLPRDTVIVSDAVIHVDPGVEVQLAPGVQLSVAGRLEAQGTANAPVRFSGPQGRWAGIFGQPGSSITLTNTEIRQAGQGGVALGANGGSLNVYNSLITDSGGGISAASAQLDVEHTRITGNNLPAGPALLAALAANQPLTLVGNIVGGNQLSRGTPEARVQVTRDGSGQLRIENNLITATNGAGLELVTAAPVSGVIRCNGFAGGTTGLTINASTASNRGFGLVIDTNSLTGQQSYGIASTIGIGAGNNWWADPSGPYDAQRNAQGKGTRAGVNVQFQPWLAAHPSCAPTP